MINSRLARIATTTAILIMLAGSAAVPAAARPLDPDPPIATRKITFPDSPWRCPLLRIDRQLVRCDNLTGAGVPAPLFIPEL
jgi:hypothetical protein